MFHIRQKNSYHSECTVNVARLIKCFSYPTSSPIVILKGIRYINFVSKTLGLHQKVVAVWADFVPVRNVTTICWEPRCNTQTAHLWSQHIWKKLQNCEDAHHMKTCLWTPFSVVQLAALSRLRCPEPWAGHSAPSFLKLQPPMRKAPFLFTEV